MEQIARSPICDLSDAVAAVVSEALDGHTDAAIGEDLISLRRSIDRLEAEFLVLLCRPHHRMVHEEGKRLRLRSVEPERPP